MNSTDFGSKRDLWFAVITWGVMPAALLSTAALGIKAGVVAWVVTAAMAAFWGLCLWIWYGTGYTVGERTLLVRAGPARWEIPLDEIRKVKRSNNPLASPAASLDRLEIKYGRSKSLLISPADQAGFLAELRRRCPQAEISA